MSQEIRTIGLSMPLRMGTVNCYLLQTEGGQVLIDTGASNRRAALEKELLDVGCRPGCLSLVVLTHGDFDHTGNAAHLRRTFGTRLAMHPDDAGMAEQGDMFWNRKSGGALFRRVIPVLFGFPPTSRFRPDLYFEEGFDLSEYGLHARILGLPGHSKGSIGVLTDDGDLFCGDLLENRGKPALNSIIDDPVAAQASVQKLQGLAIRTVYPGHGQSFLMESFLSSQRKKEER